MHPLCDICWHEWWERIKCSIYYITLLWGTTSDDCTIHGIFAWYSSLKICCMSFWFILLAPKGPLLISFPIQHNWSEQSEEWKLHFARNCLTRKWYNKHGKMNQVQWLARFFRMQKLIGCGATQENAGCWQALSLPPYTCTHRNNNDHFIYWPCLA